MSKKPNTKRALILSALCMVLCVSMLVGSTFAWFTDNATTQVNTIQSGNLSIDLQDEAGNSLEGKKLDFAKADGAPDGEAVMFEPGATYKLIKAKVVNTGNLAVKFKVTVNGLTGNAAKLAEVLEVMVPNPDTTSEDKLIPAGTLASLNADSDGIAWGILLPNGTSKPTGAPDYVTEVSSNAMEIILHMQEEADNNYQGLTLDGISLNVQATQAAWEYDSYNNTYDESAAFAPNEANVHVSTDAELKTALENADADTVIGLKSATYTLTDNLSTKATLLVESNEQVTIKMENHTIASTVDKTVNTPTVYNYGNVTLEGGTITNNNATAGNTNVAAVYNAEGNLTIKNCKIENVAPTTQGAYAVVVSGGTVTLENCTVKGNRGGIAVSGDGVVVMNGGSVTANVYYPLMIGGTGNSAFNNVTFTKLSNTKGKAITYNGFGAGSAAFTNCTFTSETSKAVPLDISNNTTGFTFTNCTFTNVTDPSA